MPPSLHPQMLLDTTGESGKHSCRPSWCRVTRCPYQSQKSDSQCMNEGWRGTHLKLTVQHLAGERQSCSEVWRDLGNSLQWLLPTETDIFSPPSSHATGSGKGRERNTKLVSSSQPVTLWLSGEGTYTWNVNFPVCFTPRTCESRDLQVGPHKKQPYLDWAVWVWAIFVLSTLYDSAAGYCCRKEGYGSNQVWVLPCASLKTPACFPQGPFLL